MRRIEDILNLPHQFFLRPLRKEPETILWYRSLASATKIERNRAERRYEWLKDISEYIQRFVELTEVNLPEFDLPDNPNLISDEDVEIIAKETRQYWGFADGPISNMIWLAENQGVIVACGEIGTESLDSFSEWSYLVRPYIFLVSEKGSSVRSRLNVAHELAHLILHRKLDIRYFERAADHKLMEDQAWKFAGAFMLPADSFSKELYAPTLDSFLSLKPRWKVSVGAMIKRADSLGFFMDEHETRRTWISYSRSGWRRNEPLDDEIEIEAPSLLPNAFMLIIDKSIVKKAQILAEGFCSAQDIETLLSIPSGYLSSHESQIPEPNVRVLDVGPTRRKRASKSQEQADVIQFPESRKKNS